MSPRELHTDPEAVEPTEIGLIHAISAELRFQRGAQGLTQAEFGAPLNMNKNQICRLENGTNLMRVDTLVRVVEQGLKLTMEQFWAGVTRRRFSAGQNGSRPDAKESTREERMKSSLYTFKQKNTDEQRVIVCGDVIALPFENWCMGGFGSSISVEWLMHERRFLPGRSKGFRLELAEMVVRALDLYHGFAK